MNDPADRLRERASLVLGLLLIAYIFNYLDRQILGILAGPIIAELHLTDTQFGVLSGPPFALLYSILGIPFAYFADRTSRSRVIAAALLFGAPLRVCAASPRASGSCSYSEWAWELAKRVA